MKSAWWLVEGRGTMAADSRLNFLKSGINIKKIWALYRLYCVCIQYFACIYVKWNGGQDTIKERCDMQGSTLLASTRKVEIDCLICLCQRCTLCWWVGYWILIYSCSTCSFKEEYAFEHFRVISFFSGSSFGFLFTDLG